MFEYFFPELCFVQHNKGPAAPKQTSTDDTTLYNQCLAEHTHTHTQCNN